MNRKAYAFDPETEDYDAALEKFLPLARHHILIECCGLYEEFDSLSQADLQYMKALERRFRKKVLHTEFVFSSAEEAYESAKRLLRSAPERVEQNNSAVIPEIIHIYYD